MNRLPYHLRALWPRKDDVLKERVSCPISYALVPHAGAIMVLERV